MDISSKTIPQTFFLWLHWNCFPLQQFEYWLIPTYSKTHFLKPRSTHPGWGKSKDFSQKPVATRVFEIQWMSKISLRQRIPSALSCHTCQFKLSFKKSKCWPSDVFGDISPELCWRVTFLTVIFGFDFQRWILLNHSTNFGPVFIQ